MTQQKVCLASDNWTIAHPLVLKSVIEANEGYAPSYGADLWTEKATLLIQEAFKPKKCKVFMVPTGTGSNVLGLKIACKRHESIICTDIAHIHYQESGASESIIGAKLLTVPHYLGKVTKRALLHKLKTERAFGKHSTSPRVLSLTLPTELGTLYSLEELKSLSKICKEENLLLHIDGSRIYNAAASLNISLSQIALASQVDILSLGGTKNGLMGAEALLIFNPDLEEGSDHLHKQTLALLSKMRYLSAQYIPFFENELWRDLALHANQKAQEIAFLIQNTPPLSLNYPLETNQLFFSAPENWIPKIREKIHCHLWDAEKNEIRFIASWNTSKEDVQNIKDILDEVSR